MTTPSPGSKDQDGLHMTTDAPVRDAIGKYEAEIAAGEITFGPEGFADTYPGRDEGEQAIRRFVSAHVREL